MDYNPIVYRVAILFIFKPANKFLVRISIRKYLSDSCITACSKHVYQLLDHCYFSYCSYGFVGDVTIFFLNVRH